MPGKSRGWGGPLDGLIMVTLPSRGPRPRRCCLRGALYCTSLRSGKERGRGVGGRQGRGRGGRAVRGRAQQPLGVPRCSTYSTPRRQTRGRPLRGATARGPLPASGARRPRGGPRWRPAALPPVPGPAALATRAPGLHASATMAKDTVVEEVQEIKKKGRTRKTHTDTAGRRPPPGVEPAMDPTAARRHQRPTISPTNVPPPARLPAAPPARPSARPPRQ